MPGPDGGVGGVDVGMAVGVSVSWVAGVSVGCDVAVDDAEVSIGADGWPVQAIRPNSIVVDKRAMVLI